MKNPIVVGVNDSEASQAAVTWAMHRAAALKLPVLLVHALDDRWSYESYSFIDVIKKIGVELLEKAKARATEAEPSVELDTQQLSGSTGAVLRKLSRKASMVVVGSGEPWLGGAWTDRALNCSPKVGLRNSVPTSGEQFYVCEQFVVRGSARGRCSVV